MVVHHIVAVGRNIIGVHADGTSSPVAWYLVFFSQ
jgi:hypothetical protein